MYAAGDVVAIFILISRYFQWRLFVKLHNQRKNITNRMLHWSYTPEQKEEVKKALAAGVPKATILTYFYPEVTVEKMSSYRNKH